jgi:hypothetical protein
MRRYWLTWIVPPKQIALLRRRQQQGRPRLRLGDLPMLLAFDRSR